MSLKNITVSEDLLKYLEDVFPDRLPSKKISDRELWILIGRVEVVRFLRTLKQREEEGDVL